MSITDTLKGIVGMDPTAHADEDMKRVLDALESLAPKPVIECTPTEARMQPTPGDAVKKLMAESGIAMPRAVAAVRSEDIEYAGADGSLPARVYRPEGEGPFPVILYFHGGGWVIADLDVYDATPRSMAALSNAIVVSAHYRLAPEHRFPAAHEDANAAWQWLLGNVARLGGDPSRLAVMGESAGANLAANVAIHARAAGLQTPLHLALVYPVASNNTMSISYEENRSARPLSKPMMLWFIEHLVNDTGDLKSTLLDLVSADLTGLPPTTVITAGIDPLRSDGEKLITKLAEAGVDVVSENYHGATHEFFGMAPVVAAAREAQALVAEAQRLHLHGQ